MLTDLSFLILTLSLLHSLIQCGKNFILKDFVLAVTGLVMELDDNLNR